MCTLLGCNIYLWPFSPFFKMLYVAATFAFITKVYRYYASKAGFSLYVFHKNSPNKVLAQANHLRVKFFGSSL